MARLRGIFFDQDGVIIDTERDGHRVSFNETFKTFGYDFQWGVDEYHELLQIAGGKERMKSYMEAHQVTAGMPPAEVDDLIKKMHKVKTEKFIELIESGQLPLRPGVKRFMQEAKAAGLIIGICTTSDVNAAHAIAYKILADVKLDFVIAGDMVGKKKPDPEIYLLALKNCSLSPDEVVVVEDSRNGLMAAKNAGLRVIATTNPYTEKEDLHEADLILTCLGDPDGEKGVLTAGRLDGPFDGVLHVSQVQERFS
ncbi:MAG TPA: HAD-IA family hydrolase, partial [Anaerolineaceae bacterium]